jgi:hypothetical protein
MGGRRAVAGELVGDEGLDVLAVDGSKSHRKTLAPKEFLELQRRVDVGPLGSG